MVDLSMFKDVKCTCGNMEYIQTYEFKIVPAVMSQTGQEEVVPIPHRFVCTQCGKDVYEIIDLMKLEEKSSLIL